MKKNLMVIVRCTLFVGIFAVLLYIASQIVRPKEITKSGSSLTALRNGIVLEKDNMVDVLIVGDSLSYSSIIPIQMYRDYGIASYISGTAAQRPKETYNILFEAFKTQKPKYVLLETNCIFRNYPVKDAVYNAIRNVFPVFTYHNRWKELKSEDLKMHFTYTCFQNSKGFRFSNLYSAADTGNYMAPSKELEEIPEKNLQLLQNIRKLCEDNGAELIFISVPSVKCYNTKKHNALVKLTDELQIKYLDMNLLWKEIGINWNTDTRDKGDHLNYRGAVKVSGYLAKYLNDFETLADHRQDKKYEYWNEDMKDFYEIINSKV